MDCLPTVLFRIVAARATCPTYAARGTYSSTAELPLRFDSGFEICLREFSTFPSTQNLQHSEGQKMVGKGRFGRAHTQVRDRGGCTRPFSVL